MAPAHAAAQQAAAAPVHHHQPAPAAGPGPGFNPFGGMFGQGGAGGAFGHALGGLFGAGGGMHGMNPAAGSFRMTYKAFSTAILEIQRGRADGTVYGASGRDNVNFGGKSALRCAAAKCLAPLCRSAATIQLPRYSRAKLTRRPVIMPPSALQMLSAFG